MRSWGSLLVLVFVAAATASVPIVRMPNGFNWAPDGVMTGDVPFVRLDPTAPDGVDGLWCSDCACDADGFCSQGVKGTDGAFAYRRNGRWECSCACGAATFECSDLDTCNLCPALLTCLTCTAQIGDACNQTSDCCEGFCLSGFCTTQGPCSANVGDPCTQTAECCTGFCNGTTCVVSATTSTTTSTSTTSTTGAVSTTSSSSTTSTSVATTSTSSSTVTTTTLGVAGAFTVIPPLPGTITNGFPASRHLYCVRFQLAATITNAVRLTMGVNGSAGAFCGIQVYEDSNTGALLGSISGACPSGSGVFTGTTTPFTLSAGATYRFCGCASSSSTNYTAIYGATTTALLDAFSVSIGETNFACSAAGVAPVNTGSLVNTGARMPIIAVTP